MKQMQECKVIDNREIAKDIYEMTFFAGSLAAQVKAGQFVNLYTGDRAMLLPRPISICKIGEDTLTVVYRVSGKGTAFLAALKPGDEINALLPLGNGYMLEEDYTGKHAMVIGGGIGIPPLVELAKALKVKGAKVTAVTGFQDEVFLRTELERYCQTVFVATETGTEGYQGNVLGLMEEEKLIADCYFACGPKAMLKALSSHCAPLQVSLEERMGCGYGACVGCACKTKGGQKAVCKDGPVFWAEEVVWDE